jgi:hypothetical protein
MRNFSVPGVILQILLSEPRGILFRLNDREFRGGACGNSHPGCMKRKGNKAISHLVRLTRNSRAADRENFVTRKTRPSDCVLMQQQISTLMERKVFLDQSVGGERAHIPAHW